MIENWKTHPAHRDYEISDLGSVRRKVARYRNAITRRAVVVRGYLVVTIPESGRIRTRPVHQLVLETFVGPRGEGQVARHLDGDKFNNRLSNLAWGSALENARDRDTHGTVARGSRQGLSKLTEADVTSIRRRYQPRKIALKQLATEYGVTLQAISAVVHSETWRHVMNAWPFEPPTPQQTPRDYFLRNQYGHLRNLN